MKSVFYFLFIFLSLNLNSNSQVTKEWEAVYNGSDDFGDIPYSIATDNFGNVYVTGTGFFKSTFQDIITIKYSSNGILQWIKYFNSEDSSNDISNSIAVDNSGNIIITGESMRRETGKDIITIKYNPNGDEIWKKAFNGNGLATGFNNDIGNFVEVDESDNVIVGGSGQGINTNFDYIVIKYDLNGNLIFQKRYSGPGNNPDFMRDLKVDRFGNIYATGEAFFPGASTDYLTVKYNSQGTEQWTARYNGPIGFGDYARSLCLDEIGNIFVTGFSYSASIDDILTVKYNSSGVQLWEARYDGSQNLNDKGYSVVADKTGNVYIAGTTIDLTTFPEFCVLKYNSSGQLVWINHFDHTGIGSGEATIIKIDENNNLYIAGAIFRVVSQISGEDFVLIKYDDNGNRLWSKYYNGAGSQDDRVSGIQLDKSGNIFITGKSKRSNFNYDFATIKYSQLINIFSVSNIIPLNFRLEQNYPNPFNPETKIRFDVPAKISEGNINLIVYDISGKEIAVLFSGNLKPGSYEVVWNAVSQSSGVYIYKFEGEGFQDSRKMILIR